MKYGLHFICFLISVSIYGQKINNYKYVIVPDKYDVMKTADQYQINALSKFLLQKYGFDAYLKSDEKPFVMKDWTCKILFADLIDNSNFLQTKVSFVLKDCEGNILFQTRKGRSKKKEYKPSYHEALRDAFRDVKALQYRYDGKPSELSKSSSRKKVEEIKEAAHTSEATPNIKVISNTNAQKEEIVISKPKPEPVATEVDLTKPILYMSEDDFYRAVAFGNSITFYEEDENIGSIQVVQDTSFPVATSHFEGIGFFKEGRLIIEMKIKGVLGKVQMIFIKQD